jgi:hypothetical protein
MLEIFPRANFLIAVFERNTLLERCFRKDTTSRAQAPRASGMNYIDKVLAMTDSAVHQLKGAISDV